MRPRDLWTVQSAGHALLFVALTFVVLFWRLGGPSFWDPDEAHYAQTTREMITSGDWWAPRFNDQPFFDKPVLFHQLQGLAMVALGPTEFAARLVPALAGLGLVFVTFWFGRSTMSADSGIVAALLLLASPGIFALSRYAILDTLFTLLLFGGAAALAIAALQRRPRLQWIGYVALAFAVLVKGPIAMVLTSLTFLLSLGASADLRRRLLALRWMSGLVLIVAISAPWFIYMYVRFGSGFIDGYFFDENLSLYARRRFGNQPGFWFYFRILAAGLLPWTALLLGRLVDDLRALARGEGLDDLEILLWTWTATVVGFFSLSQFKLDHYVFPAAPSLCLLCAKTWFDLRAPRLDARHTGARTGLHLVGPILVAIGLGCGYFLVARLQLPGGAMVVAVVLTLTGAVLTAVVTTRGGRPPRAPWLVLIAMLVTYAGIVGYVIPAVDRHKVTDDLARSIAAEAPTEARVATYRYDNAAFRFYVNRHVTFLNSPEAVRAFFAAPGPVYCLMRRPAYDEFVAGGLPLRILLEREGMAVTSGRALWRKRLPLTRFVVVTRDTGTRRPR